MLIALPLSSGLRSRSFTSEKFSEIAVAIPVSDNVNSSNRIQMLSTNGVNRITAEDSIITTPIDRRRPCPSASRVRIRSLSRPSRMPSSAAPAYGHRREQLRS